VYCRPLHDYAFIEHKEILTFEEIHRIVRLFADCGIDRIRLTGGEPLLRKNITSLVAKLSATKAAGLNRVNISIDSLEASSYKQITGYDFLSQVVCGIKKAIEVGLQPVKINAVILRGINHSQVATLAGISINLPVTVRFIEYCPTSNNTHSADDYMPYDEIRRIIESTYGALSNATIGCNNGPALYFKIKNSSGAIGFIAGRSTVFCESCNRLRMTCDGRIKPCLYSPREYHIRQLIRGGIPDEPIRDVLKKIIARKHIFTRLNSPIEKFSMRKVGG